MYNSKFVQGYTSRPPLWGGAKELRLLASAPSQKILAKSLIVPRAPLTLNRFL